jgi:hypothetical protein
VEVFHYFADLFTPLVEAQMASKTLVRDAVWSSTRRGSIRSVLAAPSLADGQKDLFFCEHSITFK